MYSDEPKSASYSSVPSPPREFKTTLFRVGVSHAAGLSSILRKGMEEAWRTRVR